MEGNLWYNTRTALVLETPTPPLSNQSVRTEVHTSDSTPTKSCSKCGVEYPATAEHFHRDRKAPNGLMRQCKACNTARAVQWGKDNPERRTELVREHRVRHPERDHDYYERNRARILAKNKEWAIAHPEVNRLSAKRYAQSHPDHVSAWSRLNPHKAKTIKNRYRANKKQAVGGHTAVEVTSLYAEQQGQCAYCGIRLFDEYQHDHVIPLSRGGSDYITNILLSCATCNQSKGNKSLSQWAETRGW